METLAGNLDVVPLPNLLYRLYRWQVTGTLALEDDARHHTVEIAAGQPASAVLSGDSVEPLGRILLELGGIREEDYQVSLVKLAETGRLHGEILREMGVLSASDLEHGLQVQLRRKLNRLFYLEGGRFHFQAKEHVVQAVAPQNPVPVIFQGVRSAYDEDRLERLLFPLVGLEVRLDRDFNPDDEALHLADDEREFLEQFREFRPFEDLWAGNVLPAFESRVLLASLLFTEALELQDEAAAWRASFPKAPTARAGAGEARRRADATSVRALGGASSLFPSAKELYWGRPLGRVVKKAAKPVAAENEEPATQEAGARRVAAQGPTPSPPTREPQERPGEPKTPRVSPSRAARAETASEKKAASEERTPPGRKAAPARERVRPAQGPKPAPRELRVERGMEPEAEPPRPEREAEREPPLREVEEPPPERAAPRPPPRAMEPRAVPSVAEMEAMLATKEKQIETANFFELLEVGRDATPQEIKIGYFRLAKQFHPDRFLSGDARAMRRRAETVFERISEAYDALRTEDRRLEYVRLLGDERVRGDRRRAQMVSQADGQFRVAEDLMAQGDFARAEEYIRRAIDLFGDDADYHAALGWATFQQGRDAKATVLPAAMKHLLKALAIKPDCERAHLCLGRIYESQGQREDAIRHFQKVLDSRPRHIEASAALARLRAAGGEEAR
jgi:hypothetical protein